MPTYIIYSESPDYPSEVLEYHCDSEPIIMHANDSELPSILVDAILAASMERHRWPQAEKYILKCPTASYSYANYILKRRWPEAEHIISTSSHAACYYAIHVLKKEWPEAEPAILQRAVHAFHYVMHIKKRRWPEAEPMLKGSSWHHPYERTFKCYI